MKDASETKAHLPQLLDDVERGETLVVTWHSRAIARIAPEARLRQEEIDQSAETMKALRQGNGKISGKEIQSTRHEDHKY